MGEDKRRYHTITNILQYNLIPDFFTISHIPLPFYKNQLAKFLHNNLGHIINLSPTQVNLNPLLELLFALFTFIFDFLFGSLPIRRQSVLHPNLSR